MRNAERTPVLFHLKPSHFNEKARWALDYKGIAHRRVTPMPGAHMLIALALTRRVATLPVLKLDGKAIGDSTRIIAALEAHQPEPALYPRDPAERERALELEELFDATLGPDVRCVAFWEFFRSPDFVDEHAQELTGARQAGVVKSPAFQAFTCRRYGINEDSAAQALDRIRATIGLIEDLTHERDHLVGDSFTVADLTAAALLAPAIAPPELPYRRADTVLPPGLQRLQDEFRARRAGEWVLRMYSRFRPPSVAVSPDGVDNRGGRAWRQRDPIRGRSAL
jgi:glutathione S-transferase